MEKLFQSLAKTIRSKKNSTNVMRPIDMPREIETIETSETSKRYLNEIKEVLIEEGTAIESTPNDLLADSVGEVINDKHKYYNLYLEAEANRGRVDEVSVLPEATSEYSDKLIICNGEIYICREVM